MKCYDSLNKRKNAIQMYLKIQTNDELFSFIDELKKHPLTWIAIDTEFHRESTYFPILSLIQLATDSQTWIIDAVSCTDLTPLKPILENKKIKKIFHAGDQDWAILKQYTEAVTWPFFDTQHMAAFAKLGHSNSLESLVSKLLEIPVDKSQQKTNWMQRPLTPNQLEYAARDAAYVAKIYPLLDQKLIELGRDKWVAQEMKALLKKYNDDAPPKEWLKFCSTGCKWPIPFYALELAKWRDAWARKLDIPKRYVIADGLLELALRKRNIAHIDKDNCSLPILEDLILIWARLEQEYPNHKKQRYALTQKVKIHHQEFSAIQRKALKRWQTKIKQVAKKLDLPAHCVLNKQQLHHLVYGKRRAISGWRKDFLKKSFYQENTLNDGK
jgi:ribonuclease D